MTMIKQILIVSHSGIVVYKHEFEKILEHVRYYLVFLIWLVAFDNAWSLHWQDRYWVLWQHYVLVVLKDPYAISKCKIVSSSSMTSESSSSWWRLWFTVALSMATDHGHTGMICAVFHDRVDGEWIGAIAAATILGCFISQFIWGFSYSWSSAGNSISIITIW
jgi:hypothetical protein